MQYLWREFRVGNDLDVQVDGIMYASRYTLERIEAHREQVITALKARGVDFLDLGERVGVNYKGHNPESVIALLDELSSLNEAADYKMHGLNSIEGLSGSYDAAFYPYIFQRRDEQEKPEAYDLTIRMLKLAIALKAVDGRNRMLYAYERRTLDTLIGLTRRNEAMLNSRRIILFPV